MKIKKGNKMEQINKKNLKGSFCKFFKDELLDNLNNNLESINEIICSKENDLSIDR